jgi:hypothetical protein
MGHSVEEGGEILRELWQLGYTLLYEVSTRYYSHTEYVVTHYFRFHFLFNYMLYILIFFNFFIGLDFQNFTFNKIILFEVY